MTKEEYTHSYHREIGYANFKNDFDTILAKLDNEVQKYADLYRSSLIVVEEQKTQLEACKDALKELIQDIEAQVYEDKELVDCIQNLNHLDRSIAKAKTLIE